MLSARQEKILEMLVREYINNAEPISSNLLKERCSLDCSPATIRNDLQTLTEMGYISQPHTSAGRMPTNKAYKYFVDKLFGENTSQDPFEAFIQKEIHEAREKIDRELQLAQELTKSLTEISSTLRYTKLQNKNHVLEILEILGPSRITYEKNIDVINKLLQDLQNF